MDLTADRWTPFVWDIDFEERDLTGAAFAVEVRDRRDGGFVRATLGTVTTEVQGVRLLGVATVDGVVVSSIRMRISEATMEAMTNAADAGLLGSDGAAWWDMHITPAGGDKAVALAGPFIIKAGATN